MPCPGEVGKYVAGQTPERCGGEDPNHGMPPKRFGDIMWTEAMKRSVRLRANHELMSRQTHALRDALGVARVLNRTLILPHYECLCDRSEDVAIVPSCVYHGAPPRLRLPFPCSQHFIADTHKLQMVSLAPTLFGMQPHKFGGYVTPPIKLRAFSFLHDERTHPEIRNGVVDVAGQLPHRRVAALPVHALAAAPPRATAAALRSPAASSRAKLRAATSMRRGLGAIRVAAAHRSPSTAAAAAASCGLFGGARTRRAARAVVKARRPPRTSSGE